MLTHQIMHHQARELALHYLSSQGATLSPEEWLTRLNDVETRFLALLKQQAGRA
ncbi:hypothetical protein ABLU83_21780 [Klebsiella sp. CN_Kp098]|uniref:hypothetical protein n=1 Tax=unclassified Klebsiella TaxID=2608929 RepID=UPI0032B49926